MLYEVNELMITRSLAAHTFAVTFKTKQRKAPYCLVSPQLEHKVLYNRRRYLVIRGFHNNRPKPKVFPKCSHIFTFSPVFTPLYVMYIWIVC